MRRTSSAFILLFARLQVGVLSTLISVPNANEKRSLPIPVGFLQRCYVTFNP